MFHSGRSRFLRALCPTAFLPDRRTDGPADLPDHPAVRRPASREHGNRLRQKPFASRASKDRRLCSLLPHRVAKKSSAAAESAELQSVFLLFSSPLTIRTHVRYTLK